VETQEAALKGDKTAPKNKREEMRFKAHLAKKHAEKKRVAEEFK